MTDCSKYEPIFGAWYIKKKIGAGSFGEVYEIERKEFGRVYRSALKVMSVPFNDDEIRAMMADGTDMESIATYYEGVVKDIAEENAIMSELKGNSYIVSYEDHQIIRHEDGIGYDILIRMELLTSLIDHLLHNPMDESDVIKLGKDLCQALIVCEQKKIIHRDIKPGNIFLSDTGDFKLGDFGIARSIEKSTGELSRKGTFTYMAPEVYKGEKYGVGADIYSLGMVMYYLLNCRRMPFLPLPPEPVTYNQKMDALRQRMEGERFQAPHEASSELAEIVMTACAYDPEDRFQSAEAFLAALESVGEGAKVPLRHGAGRNVSRQSERSARPAGEEKTELLREIPDHTGQRPGTFGTQGQQRAPGRQMPPGRSGTGTAGGTAGRGYYDPEGRTILDTGQFGTGSFGGYVQTNDQRQRVQPVPATQPSGAGKARKILLIAAAAVIVFAGGFFGMSLVNDKDSDQAKEMVLSTDDIEVVDKDVNFSQLTRGNYLNWTLDYNGVDILIKVKNNGQTPLRAFSYHLKQKGSDDLLINQGPEPEYKGTKRFLAVGYVEPEDTGFMYTKLYLDNSTRKKDRMKVSPVEIVAEGPLGDYELPTGRMTDFNKDADMYQVTVENDNDEPIHSGAAVLLLRKRLVNAKDLDGKWGGGLITKEIDEGTETLNDIIYNPDIPGSKASDSFDIIVYDPYYLADPDYPDNSEETTEE